MFSRLEQNIGGQVSQGRMDQYFYPFYKKDLEEGRITRTDAEELLQCLWLNMMQSTEVKLSPTAAASMEGFAHFEQITIGGQTPDGRDATNELTYVMLDSARPLQSSYPELAARIHANTPERFLHAVVEAIKDGKGTPKVLNDEQIVPFYLANGATVDGGARLRGLRLHRVAAGEPRDPGHRQCHDQLRRGRRDDPARRQDQDLEGRAVRPSHRRSPAVQDLR